MVESVFVWNNDFVTGQKVVDEQHHSLVQAINGLLANCLRGETIELETIESAYNFLSRYALLHFATEEQLMQDVGLDTRHVSHHKNAHAAFVDAVVDMFREPSQLTDPSRLDAVVVYLIRWLAYHILYMDKNMSRQVEAVSVEGLSPAQAFEREERQVDETSEPILRALKSLFAVVDAKNKELQRQNLELEQRVDARTKELALANEKLAQQAMHDELTGLPNRRFAHIELERLCGGWHRYGMVFALLFVDLDKFKGVNDVYGHAQGDEVLKWVAHYLQSNTRKTDLVCRLGGDEFAVICPNTGLEGATALAEKLAASCRELASSEIKSLWSPSLSVGVAVVDHETNAVSSLLNKADHAMYLLKHSPV